MKDRAYCWINTIENRLFDEALFIRLKNVSDGSFFFLIFYGLQLFLCVHVMIPFFQRASENA